MQLQELGCSRNVKFYSGSVCAWLFVGTSEISRWLTLGLPSSGLSLVITRHATLNFAQMDWALCIAYARYLQRKSRPGRPVCCLCLLHCLPASPLPSLFSVSGGGGEGLYKWGLYQTDDKTNCPRLVNFRLLWLVSHVETTIQPRLQVPGCVCM